MVHTIWIFKIPYIGSICNCNNKGCALLYLNDSYRSLNVVRESHEIAFVDMEICNGCGNCQRSCQFRAIEITGKKADVNHNCYG